MVAQNPLTPDRIDELGAAMFCSWSTAERVARERGRFIVFDVISQDCEIADSDLEATDRLAERCPDGVFWGTRIGLEAAYRVNQIASLRREIEKARDEIDRGEGIPLADADALRLFFEDIRVRGTLRMHASGSRD